MRILIQDQTMQPTLFDQPDTYTPTGLAECIATCLRDYQATLITSPVPDQGLEPVLLLTVTELKTLTGRQRGRKAFIDGFITLLRDYRLRVEMDDGVLRIVQPLRPLTTQFTTLKQLTTAWQLSQAI